MSECSSASRGCAFSAVGSTALSTATSGPGLVGALLVGMQVEKALKKPLVGANHLSGHVFAIFALNAETKPPDLARFRVIRVTPCQRNDLQRTKTAEPLTRLRRPSFTHSFAICCAIAGGTAA